MAWSGSLSETCILGCPSNILCDARGSLLLGHPNVDLTRPKSALIRMDNHHLPFVLLINVYDEIQCLSERHENPEFEIKACDYSTLHSAFNETDWDLLLGNENLNEILPNFYKRLHDVFNVPIRRNNSNLLLNNTWCTPERRNLRNSLTKAPERFFESWSEHNTALHREMETTLFLATYESYISDTQSSTKANLSRFDFIKWTK